MTYQPDDIVKSCRRLESGLRLGPEAIRACCLGPIVSPPYWTSKKAKVMKITKADIMAKRKELFDKLNDDHSDISCKRCLSVVEKPFKEVRFDRVGHLNLSHFSMCNLRCAYCSYTIYDDFVPPQYDALSILQEFDRDDVEWDSYVDLNGGEPTLLKNLDQFIHYFNDRKVRILLYTNGLRFRQSIYDGIAKGTIAWLIVSLDCGTARTFQKLKKSNKYNKVLENLARYAQAGSVGGGQLAVKYVFCDMNCGIDDVLGFSYAMLAIRPQKIWLTVDFTPMCDTDEHPASDSYDYSKHIEAYAHTYLTLKQHGLEAVHFVERHTSGVVKAGQDIYQRIKQRIEELEESYGLDDPGLFLQDFRTKHEPTPPETLRFDINPLCLRKSEGGTEAWSLEGKRVMIAPVWRNSASLAADPEIMRSRFLGFLDRSLTLQGRKVHGSSVHAYSELVDLAPDVVLVDSPGQHRDDIVRAIFDKCKPDVAIATLDRVTDETVK